MDWKTILYEFLRRPGIEGEVLEAYPDPATKGEPFTIGVGHTGKVDGVPVHLGMKITPAKSRELCFADMTWAGAAVDKYVIVPLTDSEKAALASLCFNIGPDNFGSSTLVKLLNRSNKLAAADQFLVWNKARVNGVLQVMNGLTNRRKLERQLFLGGSNA